MLFWVAATFKPRKKSKDEEEKAEELIIQPTIIVAKDDKTAAMKATIEKADTLKSYELDRVSVYVRPF